MKAALRSSGYDHGTHRLFITNGNDAAIDVIDIKDPKSPTKLFAIDLTPYGKSPNSVAVKKGIVAVAVENSDKQQPGKVVFFDVDGNYLNDVMAGALPDMVTFTPNGKYCLVANEGEPDDDYVIDPEGTVTIVCLKKGAKKITPKDVKQVDFKKFNNQTLDPSIRIYGPGATVAQDLEPEYITTSEDGKWAWVTCQENNAMAKINIRKGKVVALYGLGFKDHMKKMNGLDASNKDDAINIRPWPVKGIFQPDAIAAYYSPFAHQTLIVTANEGDSRDYDGYSEEERVKDLVLDPTAFPNAADLQQDEKLGRLNTTTANGDIDGDGDFDEIYAYGARSFSIFTSKGELVYDSGDEFEQITAKFLPNDFNSTNDENGSFDNRSDDKGPEPEALTVGRVLWRTYAFIGLERVGGIMVYDITFPFKPHFVQYINTRDFSGDPEQGTAGDLAPEGIIYIPWYQSPNKHPLVVVANEVSGSTTIFQVNLCLP